MEINTSSYIPTFIPTFIPIYIISKTYSHIYILLYVPKNQLTFCNELSIMEKLTYMPHPTQEETTLLKQEAVITVHGVPLSSYFEDFLSKTISGNANKVGFHQMLTSFDLLF